MEIYDVDRFHLITIRVTIFSSVNTNMEAVRGTYFLNKHMAGLVVSSMISKLTIHIAVHTGSDAYRHT